MAKNPFKNFFHPGQRGKLRWAIFAIAFLFAAAAFIDAIGFNNSLAQKIDQGLSAVPVVNGLKIWPKKETDAASGNKSLAWKSIEDIDLTAYGRPFKLGLDLLGGTHLIYSADVSKIASGEQADSLSGVRDVIERRVNALGVSEPNVQTNRVGDEWRVIVELAGVYDVNEAIKIIGETPLLEFKEEAANQPADLTAEQQTQLTVDNQKIKEQAQGILDQALTGADFAALAQNHSQDPGSKDNGGLYTAIKKNVFVPEVEDVIFNKLQPGQIYPQLVQSQFGYHVIKLDAKTGEGDNASVDMRHILFLTKTASDFGVASATQWETTKLTGQYLKKSSVEFDNNSGVPQVALEFNDEGAQLFGDITSRNVGKPVAIFLDGQAISVPNVNEPITTGKAVISGNFSISEAKVLSQRLNAGALPVPIKLISQTTVGATLGNQSVQQSLVAGFWGLMLVALFMILYYRLPGVVSVLALLIYTVLALALFKLIPVTMTLAGIAGFVLSIGMAVDANVLIFERMKEELRAGRNLASAVDEGFRRAWSSILDSNVSSLITCLILFLFSSNIIKGFAFTLAIGILVSMFSAVTITRQFLRLIVKWKLSKFGWLYRITSK